MNIVTSDFIFDLHHDGQFSAASNPSGGDGEAHVIQYTDTSRNPGTVQRIEVGGNWEWNSFVSAVLEHDRRVKQAVGAEVKHGGWPLLDVATGELVKNGGYDDLEEDTER